MTLYWPLSQHAYFTIWLSIVSAAARCTFTTPQRPLPAMSRRAADRVKSTRYKPERPRTFDRSSRESPVIEGATYDLLGHKIWIIPEVVENIFLGLPARQFSSASNAYATSGKPPSSGQRRFSKPCVSARRWNGTFTKVHESSQHNYEQTRPKAPLAGHPSCYTVAHRFPPSERQILQRTSLNASSSVTAATPHDSARDADV
ncbi:hypothetical protein DOTSEDRAFT_38466 [Dothistroma septosporum NZE10]|uniref:Secreted protein n=1 Tax=Dothistroma septosporum (strain NZE10 / CBS 128990) TaxID=675120 RepID=M2YK28_DOTSN|nr:hypothetical protein DOTSEDRAFT_38466 [Dothistroma septosporum NZE10]